MAAGGLTHNLAFAFVGISLGGLLFGYVIGITSNVVIAGQVLCTTPLIAPVGTWTSVGYNQCYELNSFMVGLLSSLNIVGALASTLVCFRFSDDLGRKLELQIGAVLYFAGAAVTALSPTLWGIFLGFFVYGLGVGFAMHAAPVFIAEMSPSSIRGALVAGKEAIVVIGICFGFLGGFAFTGVETVGWRWMVAGSAPFAVLMFGAVTCLPESPRFLVLTALTSGQLLGKSRYKAEALASLEFFRQSSGDEVSHEMEDMVGDIERSVGTEAAKWTDAFEYPHLLRIGCGIVLLQQVTGQPTVLYFASGIFKSAGLGQFASLSSLLVGLVKLAATCVAAWRVDDYGRRSLLFAGITMMVVALAIVSFAFIFQECEGGGPSGACLSEQLVLPVVWGQVTVLGLMLYVSGYQVGFGPISWLLISEIFPLRVRGAAFSVAAMVNFGANILMTSLQPVMLDVLTPAGVFFLYLVLSILSLGFVFFYVPESKGKTLEEIEAMLAKGRLD